MERPPHSVFALSKPVDIKTKVKVVILTLSEAEGEGSRYFPPTHTVRTFQPNTPADTVLPPPEKPTEATHRYLVPSPRSVISTEAAQYRRATQWRDPAFRFAPHTVDINAKTHYTP
ncbi:hypothetical protein [Tunturibacter empetritectus]|uniref:Uncharacterized protein n=1 Tax=Tunturiibacter lichenicola TaxID=2051959 RepID=A0A852VP76_9BACT|nr:hypothetical protein [Edaphobacter lichenicola]NYF91172.1 hypothetical protein [Edaphobacter lichenicola]